jgi:hypothetical protein
MANGNHHHAPARKRHLLNLHEELASARLLLRREVLPGFHALQPSLLLLRRQAVEVAETLPQLLLLLRRQLFEARIIFQRFQLLFRRKIFVLAQPVPGVGARALLGLMFGLAFGSRCLALLTAFFPRLSPSGSSGHNRYRDNREKPARDGTPLPHR